MISVNKTDKKTKNTTYNDDQLPSELEDKMRVFVNLIIDKVLEERRQGIYRS